MPEVKAEDLDLLKQAAKGLHATLEKAGKALDPKFRADSLYERTDPVEAIGSLMKSVINTAVEVEKRAVTGADERAKPRARAERVVRRGEMEKKGAAECPECKGVGMVKVDGEDGMKSCPACHGSGEVEKAKKAKTLAKTAVPVGAVAVERPMPAAGRAPQRRVENDDNEEFG